MSGPQACGKLEPTQASKLRAAWTCVSRPSAKSPIAVAVRTSRDAASGSANTPIKAASGTSMVIWFMVRSLKARGGRGTGKRLHPTEPAILAGGTPAIPGGRPWRRSALQPGRGPRGQQQPAQLTFHRQRIRSRCTNGLESAMTTPSVSIFSTFITFSSEVGKFSLHRLLRVGAGRHTGLGREGVELRSRHQWHCSNTNAISHAI